MNRQQRRLMEKRLGKSGVTPAQRKIISNRYKYEPLREGQKVKINYELAIRLPEWKDQRDDFKNWVTAHKDEVFTVERPIDGGLQVTFAEDDTDPKWVLHTAVLKPLPTATIKLDNGENKTVVLPEGIDPSLPTEYINKALENMEESK